MWTVPHRLMCWNTCSLGGGPVLAGCGTLRRNIHARGSGLLERVYRISGLYPRPTSYPLSTHDLPCCMYTYNRTFFCWTRKDFLSPPPHTLFFTPIPFLSFPLLPSEPQSLLVPQPSPFMVMTQTPVYHL